MNSSHEKVAAQVRDVQAELQKVVSDALLHDQMPVGKRRRLVRRKVRYLLHNPACQLLACRLALNQRPQAEMGLELLWQELRRVEWRSYLPHMLRPGERPRPLDDAVFYLWGLIAEVGYRKVVRKVEPSEPTQPPVSDIIGWAQELTYRDADLRSRLGYKYGDNRVYHLRPASHTHMFSREVLKELQLSGMSAPGLGDGIADALGVTPVQLAPDLFTSAYVARAKGAKQEKVQKEVAYVTYLRGLTLGGHLVDPHLLRLWYDSGYFTRAQAQRPGTVAYYMLPLAWHWHVHHKLFLEHFQGWCVHMSSLDQAVLYTHCPNTPEFRLRVREALSWGMVDIRCLSSPAVAETHADTALPLTADIRMRWLAVAPGSTAVPVLETPVQGITGPTYAEAHLAGLRSPEVDDQKPLWALEVIGTADAEQVACTRTLLWRADSQALSRGSVPRLLPPRYTTARNTGGWDLEGVWLAVRVVPGFVTRKGARLPAIKVQAFRARDGRCNPAPTSSVDSRLGCTQEVVE